MEKTPRFIKTLSNTDPLPSPTLRVPPLARMTTGPLSLSSEHNTEALKLIAPPNSYVGNAPIRDVIPAVDIHEALTILEPEKKINEDDDDKKEEG
jgi:hypothetical protein